MSEGLATTKKKPVHAHNATCPVCGASFYARSYGAERRQAFCSRECCGRAKRIAAEAKYDAEVGQDQYGRTVVKRVCQHCGGELYATPTKIRVGEGLYCSRQCADAGRSKNTKEDGWVSSVSSGYIERRWRDPDTRKVRSVNEHRAIWEAANGPIPEGYQIHHVDGDKTNNALDNLRCLSRSAHMTLHSTKPEIWGTLPDGTKQKRCSSCGEFRSYDEYSFGGKRPRGECKECRNRKARMARKGDLDAGHG